MGNGALQKERGDELLPPFGLGAVLVDDLVRSKQALVFVAHDASIEAVLSVLKTSKVLSRRRLTSQGARSVVGFVSVLDLVAFALRRAAEGGGYSHVRLQEAVREPVGAVLLTAPRSEDSLYVTPYNMDLAAVLDPFSRGSVHRAMVPSASAADTKVLSQRDVVDYVLLRRRDSPLVEWLLAQTPRGLCSLGVHNVVSVHRSTPLCQALALMVAHRVQAVPVLEDETPKGAVVATLSMSNLRGVTAGTIAGLQAMTVGEFFASDLASDLGAAAAQVTFPTTATFAVIVGAILHSKVHRAWLVDDDGRPLGVISLTDILAVLHDAQVSAATKAAGKKKDDAKSSHSPVQTWGSLVKEVFDA